MLRKAIAGLSRYIATPYTARHRPFLFLDSSVLPDAMIYVVASSDAYLLGVLSSKFHHTWCRYCGGTLQDRPRYNSNRTFLPFPFPDTADEPLKESIRDAAERLDALRKKALADNPDLTLTKLYNVLEAMRTAEAKNSVLSEEDGEIATRGCVPLMRQYHDAIDAYVAKVYCWPVQLSDEEVLERLIALNHLRALEEANGHVKWLRQAFQAPSYFAPSTQAPLALPEAPKLRAEAIEWPNGLPGQVVAVAGVVERAGRPVSATDVARAFKGKRASTIAPVLDALTGMGRLRRLEDGRYAA